MANYKSEFLVNTTTRSGQVSPTITSLSTGGFVISWLDGLGQVGNESNYGIKAQIFDASGAKVGWEFRVSAETLDFNARPTITSLTSGGFVVSWTDTSFGDADVKAQIFDASGAKVGSEFLVNTETLDFQGGAKITSLSSGGFVVSWMDGSGQGGDASESGIKAQIFDASGAKVGSEFLVNTETLGRQDWPTITSLTSGGFVVSWTDGRTTLGDANVKAQIFDASGAKVGSEFLVNTTTSSGQVGPHLASLSTGGFVVSWDDYSGGQVGVPDPDIKAQIFDASGAMVGSELLVNTETRNFQTAATIASIPSGEFVVSWLDFSGRGGDASPPSIKAQIFDASGGKIGSEFLVNTTTSDGQWSQTIASIASGEFVVSWHDFSGRGGDASLASIKARIFSLTDYFHKISGTQGNDTLVGTEAADLISARPGDDTLVGNGGNDTLYGNQGSDTLLGGEGNDELYGGVGDDFLFGGSGNDLLDGHGGDDQLIDLFGDNVFDTGRGNDYVVAGAGDDEFLFDAADRGHDTIIGFGNGDDTVRLIGTRFAEFGDVLAAGEDTTEGWRLQIDNDTSITFVGIVETQLVAEDFFLL